MKRVVIGLVGQIASGKGFLAEDLKRNGFSYFSLSDRVREETDRRGLKRERATLQDVGNDMRRQSGPNVCAKETAALVKPEDALVVIDSIRNPVEIDYLKVVFGEDDFTVVGVDADAELRLGWYLERAKVRGEDGVTEADFWQADDRDQGRGEDSFGQQGAQCLKLADIRLANDGTEKFLREGREVLTQRLGLNLEGVHSSREQR